MAAAVRMLVGLAMVFAVPVLGGGSWDFWGKTANNDKYAAESILTPENVGSLQVAWQIEARCCVCVFNASCGSGHWRGGRKGGRRECGRVVVGRKDNEGNRVSTVVGWRGLCASFMSNHPSSLHSQHGVCDSDG
jgi:hypothetical protein